jgi:GT2 family glycosyltransferase
MASEHRVQLVLTTVGRPRDLERFLQSLDRQTYRDFHLVVVDQSDGDEIGFLCRRHEERFSLTRVRSQRGASRGRNAGLAAIAVERAGGRIVAFPDDDCAYPERLLEDVLALLDRYPAWDGCTGRAVTAAGARSTGRWDQRGGRIVRGNVWRRGVAFTIFLREDVPASIGGFDEAIGPGGGTDYGAGEETDYLLRALEAGFRIEYVPDITVVHPDGTTALDPSAIAKAHRYGVGMAFVMRRHGYPWWFIAYACLRPFGGALLALSRGRVTRARYHWAMFAGRLSGALDRRG